MIDFIHTMKLCLIGAILLFSSGLYAQTTFTVSNTSDSGAGSLRQAIIDAETSPGADIINVPAGTITLASALPNITEDLTISGVAGTIISGADLYRPFFIGSSDISDNSIVPIVVFQDFTISNGLALGSDAERGGAGAGMGGAIFIGNGDISMDNIVLDNNTAQGGSSGIDQGISNEVVTIGGDGPYVLSGGAGGALDGGSATAGANGLFGGGGGASNTVGGGNGEDGGNGGYGAGGGGGGAGSFSNGDGGLAGTFGGAGAVGFGSFTEGGGGAGLGAAIFLREGTLSVTNSTFSNNTATGGLGGSNAGNGQGKGAGIFNYLGTATVVNPTFDNNQAANAGSSASDNADIYGTFDLVTNAVVDNQPVDQLDIAEGISATFSVATSGSVDTYQWQVDQGSGFVNLSDDANYSGVTSQTLNLTCVPRAFNGNQYRIQVTGALNSVNSEAATLTVANALDLEVSISGEAEVRCTGGEITLTAQSLNTNTAEAYQWIVNGMAIVGATEETFSTTVAVGDEIAVELSEPASCFPRNTSVSESIIVGQIDPENPTVSIDQSLVCPGQSVTLSASYTEGGDAPAFQWTVNGENVGSNQSSLEFIPQEGDEIQVTLTSSEPCLVGSTQVVSELLIVPTAPIDMQPTDAEAVIFGSASAVFTIGVTDPSATIQWQHDRMGNVYQDFADGVFIGSSDPNDQELTASGSTASTLTLTNIVDHDWHDIHIRAIVSNGVCDYVSAEASLIFVGGTIVVQNENTNGSGSLAAALDLANTFQYLDTESTIIDLTGRSGTIELASPLEVSASVTFLGPGAATLTLSWASGSNIQEGLIQIDRLAEDGTSIEVDGLTLDGTNNAAITDYGIYFAQVDDASYTIKNSVFENFSGEAVIVASGTLSVENITVQNNTRGLLAEDLEYGLSSITNSSFLNNGGDAMVARGTNVVLSGITSSGNLGRGIEIYNQVELDNSSSFNNGVGLLVGGEADVNTLIQNSKFYSNDEDGISLFSLGTITLDNVQSYNNAENGVLVGNTGMSTITGSSIYGNQGRGIRDIQAGTLSIISTTISDNVVDGIGAYFSDVLLQNVTITGNGSVGLRGNSDNIMEVNNSIIIGNGTNESNFTTVEFTSTQGHNIYSFAFSPPNLTGITEGNRSDLPIEFVLEDLVTTNDSRYYPLVSNSLIINEGSEAQEVPNTDQQGNPRVGISDPGAVEFQSSPSEENFEVIVTQDVLGCAGENATFSVQLTNGGDAPTLQWLLNGEEVDGATGETFEAAVSGMEEISVTATSNVPFRLDAHTKTTDPVTIQFLPVPEISTQPQNLQALNNSPLTFSVVATGIDLTYQWQESIDGSNFTDLVDGASVSGATSPDLTVTASFEKEGYQYRVVLQEVGGCEITSSSASYIIPEPGLVLNTNSSGAGSFNQAMTDAITLGSTEADPFIINATGVTGTIDLASYLGDITEGKTVINGPTDGELILNNAASGDFIFFELQNDAILEINHITLNGGSSTEAGAILISGLETEAQLIINDSKFTNNTISEIKKGIIHSSSERTVSISINRTEFVGNTATQFLITTPSSDGVVIQLTECLYTNNSVQGIYTEYSQDTFTATDQRIIGNEITYNAFGLEGGLLEGVVFQNNTGDGNFAAIFTTGTIRNSAVVNNEGGLIYQNGGLMENVLVYGNSYSTGLISDIVSFTGGLMNHMTIFDNDAINPVNLNSQDNGQSISNSIILGSDSRPGGVTNGTIVSDFGHNIFGPTTATLDGVTTGNMVNAVVEDVLIATLVDDGVNIPYLLPSPCGIAINAADNAGVLAQDLLGNDRVGIADIGALEYQGTPIDGEEDFTATLSTSVPLVTSCAGGILDAAFEAIPSINSGLFQFAWTVNDIEVAGNTANQNISDLEVGDIIEVTITSVAGSCVSSEPLVLNATVESLEVIEEFTAIIDSNVPLVVCDGTVDATLEALPVTGGDFGPFNYSWTLNGQAVGGNEVNLGLTNLAEGDVIEVTITSESPKCLVNASTTAQITVAPLVLDVTFDAIGINSQNQSALGFTFNDIPGSDLSFSYTISDGINTIDGSGNTEGSSMNFGPFDFTTFNEGNVTLTFSLDGLESCAAIQTIRKELSLPELISAKDIELIEGQTLLYVAASNKSATAEIANLPEWITSETRVEGSVVSNIIVEEGGIDGDIVQGSMLYSEYMAIDAQGNLYFTEDGSYERLDGEFVEVVRLRVITKDGYIRTVAGDEQGYQDGAGTDALFSNVGGIAVDAEGNIYWADRYIHVIRKVTPEGVVTTLAGQYENAGNVTGSFATAQFNQPMELAFGPDGLLYFFEGGNYQIKRIDLDAETVEVFSGSGSRSIDDGAAGVASFSKAENLSIDDQGNIYLEDEGLLRVVSADGSVTTPIASDRIGQGILDGPLSEAQTNSGEVDNLTISAQGIVYFRDGPYIRKIEDGIVTTLLGGSYSYLDGPLSSARIGAGFFVDMAVDPNGIVQFLEYFNDQAYLRSILPAGTFYTGSSEGHAGDYILDLTLTDEVGNQVTEAVNLSVDVAVPFGYTVVIDETNSSASFTISNAVVGVDYSYTISDSDGNSITNTGTISTSSEQITGVSLSGLNDGIVTIRFFQFNEAGNGSIMSVSSFKETEAPIFEEHIVDLLEGEALDFEVFGSNDLGARIELVSAPDWMTYTDPGDTVILIAGNVNGTTGTADGVGTSAEFLSISHLASSSDGTIYIADLYTVRSLAPDGTVTTIAGTNEGTDRSGYVDAVGADARFTLVNGLEFLDGSLYAADYSNTVLRKVELDGTTSTVFGTTETTTMDGPFSSAEMGRPLYLVADGDGNLLVGDGRGGAIKRIDLTAQTYTTLFGDPDGDDRRVLDGFGTEARLSNVENLAYDGENYLYGIDDRLIRRFDLQTFETISYSVNEDGYSDVSPAAIGNFAFESGRGLDVDEKDNLFIADDYYDRLLLLSAQGSVITLAHTGEAIDGSPETTGIFIENATGSIRDVLITSDGKIYFTDQSKVFEWQFRNPVVTASSADTQGKVGSHEVVIKAIDGAGNETQQTIMVNVLIDIQFNSDPITTAEDGSEYEYLVDASAISGTPLTLTTGTLPDWLSFDIETNVLSGTPDDEDVGVYDILITASDGNASTEDLTQSFILTVTNVNEAPTAISISKSDIDEDAEVGEIVGVLSTVDEDMSDTHTYEVLTSFNIDGQDVFPVIVEESNLVTTIPMDFETFPLFEIEVMSTDAGGLSIIQSMAITITDVNEAPQIADQTLSISEESGLLFTLGSISGFDPESDAITYTILSGNEDDVFTLTETGQLNLAGDLDFETTPTYELLVNGSDGELSDNAIITINVTDENEGPTGILLSSAVVVENMPAGTIVGTFTATDQDAGDSHTYEIISSTMFFVGDEEVTTLAISGENLVTAIELDYERVTEITILVRAEDFEGGQVSDGFTISVTDVNEAPVIVDQTFEVDEDLGVGRIVGQLPGVDDEGQTITYTINSGNETGDFEIDTNGNVLVANNLDFETASFYELLISGTDGEFSVDATITININDVNEAPIGITLSANTIFENLAVGTSIGLLEAIDEDANATHTFSLIEDGGGANDNAAFGISDNTLVSAEVFDFETRSSYLIVVRADDGAGGVVDEGLTITITDEQEGDPQTITFDPIADKTFGDQAFELIATASSNLAVSFTSSDETVLSIAGATATILAAGEVTVTATQAGNDDFSMAIITQTITINKAEQTITFDEISDQLTGADPITLNATTNSTLAIDYSVTGPASLEANVLTITGTGEVQVTASQAGNENYLAASVTRAFVVTDPAKTDQIITFNAPDFVYIDETPIVLEASSDSGLEIEFEVISGGDLANLSGSNLNLTGTGTVEVAARQAGNDTFNPAVVIAAIEIKPVFTLSGMVTDENELAFSDGSATLIKAGETQGPIATLNVDGTYTFTDVRDGTYYVGIIPNDEEAYYITAYGNEIIYQNATPIVITTANVSGTDIQMVARPNEANELTGDGVVTGRVLGEDGESGSRVVMGRILEGTPVEGASIFLVRKSDDKILTEVFSDVNGDFEIAGIPDGTYDILINIPGVEGTISQEISVAEDEELLMTAVVGDEGIVFDVEEVLSLNDFVGKIEAYPNPVLEKLTVAFGYTVSDLDWSLVNLEGQIIQNGHINEASEMKLNFAGLSNGMYFLILTDAIGGSHQLKIIK